MTGGPPESTLFPHTPLFPSLPGPALVVVDAGARGLAEHGHLLDGPVADPRMLLGDGALLGRERGRLQQDALADPDLADVVQERRKEQLLALRRLDAEPLRNRQDRKSVV